MGTARWWAAGAGAALGCWTGVQPAQAAAAAEKKQSWLPAKPGGGDREMPPADPRGRPRVIFQGELGAYGETAVAAHFDKNGAIPVPCDDFETVRAASAASAAARCSLPPPLPPRFSAAATR